MAAPQAALADGGVRFNRVVARALLLVANLDAAASARKKWPRLCRRYGRPNYVYSGLTIVANTSLIWHTPHEANRNGNSS